MLSPLTTFRAATWWLTIALLIPIPPVSAIGTSALHIEIIPAPQCADGVDNDSDGRIDFPVDVGCASDSDTNEVESATVASDTTRSPRVSAPSAITFTGYAYPGSTVALLQDARVVTTTVADVDAHFATSISKISSGSYLFHTYTTDTYGTRSSLYPLPVSVTGGTTTNVSGIFLAPTLALQRNTQNDTVTFFGQSVPNADILLSISLDDTLSRTTRADGTGIYTATIALQAFAAGSYRVYAQARISESASATSDAVHFDLDAPSQPSTKLRADLTADGRVNLVDLSILAYWYKRPTPPALVDLNSDGVVNLTDISILSFYWTG